MLETLTEKFCRFAKTLPGSEDIDDLPDAQKLQSAKRADFLFENRGVVCEVKELATETNEKVWPILKKAGLTLVDGDYELTEVLRGYPDADALYKKVITSITRGLVSSLEAADKQISDTKKAFQIPHAQGLVVVLHGSVRVLNPDVIASRILHRFNRSKSHVSYLRHVGAVLIVSELHWLGISDSQAAPGLIPLENRAVVPREKATAIASYLGEEWARFNGRKLILLPEWSLRK